MLKLWKLRKLLFVLKLFVITIYNFNFQEKEKQREGESLCFQHAIYS